jgi:hypothetical protein
MRSKVETEWQVGWKETDTCFVAQKKMQLTGTSGYAEVIHSGEMEADKKPTLKNENGWYLYTKRQHGTVKVLFKGKCIYGGRHPLNPTKGVRAEIIKFPENFIKRHKIK